MRLDKFLKLSRLVKRRTAAQEMAEIGAVRINGRVCKQSSEVRENDTIEIAYPRHILTVKVLNTDESALKRGAAACEAISDKKAEPDIKPW
ncbi:MAG: RNA-binding S4 domain-containing protein [Synergistes sp.]|nr:RNA-binding S4 domain-containing protein [Synergistes sp.]